MVLTCIKVKRFEKSMFSCTWLLQQTAATLIADTIFWRRSWKRKLKVWYLCIVMRTASHCLLLYCGRFVSYAVRNCESSLMQLWKCFTASPFGLPVDASNYNEDKRSLAAARMQKRWLSSEATVRARSEILVI